MVVNSATTDYDEDPKSHRDRYTSTTVDCDDASEDPRSSECVVCMEEHPTDHLVYFCSASYSKTTSESNTSHASHGYCDGCLVDGIRSATEGRYPFRCCGKTFNTNEYSCVSLSAEEKEAYEDMVVEINTPSPVYCSNPQCSSFIKPDMIQSDLAICLECSASTCKHCRQPYHPTVVCTQDQDTLKVLALGKKKGWKQCPMCNYMIELVRGCHIIKCRCSWSFCYECGASNKSSLDDRRHTWHRTCWGPPDHGYAAATAAVDDAVNPAIENGPPPEEQLQPRRNKPSVLRIIKDRWRNLGRGWKETWTEEKLRSQERSQERAREFRRELELERLMVRELALARRNEMEAERVLKLKLAREKARIGKAVQAEWDRNKPAINDNDNNNRIHDNQARARAMPQQNVQPQQQPPQEPRNRPAYRGRGYLWMGMMVSPSRPNQPENNNDNYHQRARLRSEQISQQPRNPLDNHNTRERSIKTQPRARSNSLP
ncbi:hypothetical protein B0T09DRAFT_64872 [Sordaria sp. MPI-SDFR-AT-0083]|nr:hypothetical protein B0T09DRAFT_64872 [Sordaria sp. MPI-SDFR-AT-0083]